MDTKALAKSKRAHSIHHSRKHQSHQVVKVSSSSSGASSGGKKPAVNQAREKSQQSQDSRVLPSNWDRYGEDYEFGSESGETASQPSEFVVPKSKGADYAHLISEAKTQSQDNCSSDIFSSFSDTFNDFTQDFGPLLSEKGQSILSWVSDDNFELEGKASTSLEVPFLSLNLKALAEQLAKVKPSKRLFVDPEVIPPELLDDEIEPSIEDKSNQIQTSAFSVAVDSGASSVGHGQERSTKGQSSSEPMPSVVNTTRRPPVPVSNEGWKPIEQSEILQFQDTDSNISKPAVGSVARTNPPILEVQSVEAELDMLLNSFGETMPLESSSWNSEEKTPSRMRPANIDDLLNETSESDPLSQSYGVKISENDVPSSSASSKFKLLDDFDSWLDTI